MGLFNVFKSKDKKQPINEFKPHIIKTDNIAHSLNEISKQYDILVSNLDFDILSVDTYVKLTKESDFVVADNETIELIKEKDLLLDEHLEIKQSYEIKVRKFKFLDDFELVGKLKVDKDITHATYTISPSSLLIYNDLLEIRLIDELKKKKLKSGMLIDTGLFDGKFYDDIQNLVAKIRVLGSIENEVEIEMCQAKTPKKPRKLQIVEHYKKHKTTHKKIKDFIYPIKKNEMIIEIIKPQKGKNGRSCRGKLIKVDNFKEVEIPTYHINDDITKKEDNISIKYIANKNGYVYIKENVISIKDELEVNQISLKTGNITGAEDSDVKLEVKESGVLKEAIKDGMIVETTELLVKGNVGNGAKIKAKKLEIDGQTHKGSKILAQNAEINSHKGYLKANTALINRLEGGIIEANQVHITQAISGKVIAKEIKIDLLGSHLTLISSDLIEIETIRGSENKFIIDEAVVAHKEDYIKSIEEKIHKIDIKINQYKDKFKSNKIVILKNQKTIELIKNKIQEHKEKNEVVNPVFIQKIKKFNDFVKKTKKIEEEIKNLQYKKANLKNELDKMQNGIFLAKIVSHSGFPEFNRIEFHLTEPPIKIVYDTVESDRMKNIFMLKDYGEMDYKIVGESE